MGFTSVIAALFLFFSNNSYRITVGILLVASAFLVWEFSGLLKISGGRTTMINIHAPLFILSAYAYSSDF